MFILMGWYLWTNTENLLDVCSRNDTFYLATSGGLLVVYNDSVIGKYTKLDGINTAEVLSVSCENGLWILSGRGLQYFEGGKFKTLNLISFDDPEEVLNAKKIRIKGQYMFILGKTRVLAYRITDSTEVPFYVRFNKPKYIEIFRDSLVVGDTLGLYKVLYSEFSSSLWDTVFLGRPVFSAVRHPYMGWLIGTDTGILDTNGNVIHLPGRRINFMSLRGDTIWVSTDTFVYRIDPSSSPVAVKGGYALYLSKDFVGFGKLNTSFYMFGEGIYRIPDFKKLKTRGLPYTTITSMLLIGESLIACGRGGNKACAVWPSGDTFGLGLVNVARYYDGKIYLGLNGGGLVILSSDFSDTVRIEPSELGGFGYVFDITRMNGNIYFVSWEPLGNAKVFKIVDTVAEETGFIDYATNILYSAGDRLILCGQGVCKVLYSDFKPYGSITANANIVYHYGDTLFIGTSDGLEVYSLSTLGFITRVLKGISITGIWRGLDGKLWLSGSHGLIVLDKNFNVIKTYTPENSPMPGYSISPTSLYPLRFTILGDAPSGRVYIATDKGIGILQDTSVSSGWWESLKVYPNPARRNATVRILNCPEGASLKVFTPSGILMKEVRSCSFKNDLPAGLYIIHVEHSGKRTLLKVVLLDR